MEVRELPAIAINDPKTLAAFNKLSQLHSLLLSRQLPDDTIIKINALIDNISVSEPSRKTYSRSLRMLFRILERDLRIVPIHHYRNLYMAIGMTVFGVPLGVVFSSVLDNYAFIGIGLPIGLAIGIGIGTAMDEKARKEGRQLEIELR